MKLASRDFLYLAICVEGLFCGLYSGISTIFLRIKYHRTTNKKADKWKDTTFYALCALYILSVATFAIDITVFVIRGFEGEVVSISSSILRPLGIIQPTIFGCCDFIAQSILIYRCWIVWDRNIRVIIVPSILALTFLAIWIAGSVSPLSIIHGHVVTAVWGDTLVVTGLVMSIMVNALVTGLIVFKIFKVFRDVNATTSEDLTDGNTTFMSVIIILIESGIALFSIQLTRLVVATMSTSGSDSPTIYDLLEVTGVLHQMLNGITPTVILVRVSMGSSFRDKNSRAEFASANGSQPLCFAPTGDKSDDSNLILETGSINIIDSGERRDDLLEFRLTYDVE